MERLEDSFIPNLKPLFKTVISPFNNTIVVANSIRAKPYKKGRSTASIPKKYLDHIGTKYLWDEKGVLVDAVTKKIIPSNSGKVGKPRVWNCNMQSLYNGSVKEFARNSYMQKMKEFILPFIGENEMITEKDLILELKFFLEKKSQGKHNIDIDNISSIWFKAILDAIKGVIILEDDTSIVTGLKSSVSFVNEEETRLEISIFKRN